MSKVEGGELMYGQFLRVMLLPLMLLILELSAILKNTAKHGQILGLTRKDLDMLMRLRCACLGTAIKEVEALDCSKGKDGMFEVVPSERIALWLKLTSYH